MPFLPVKLLIGKLCLLKLRFQLLTAHTQLGFCGSSFTLCTGLLCLQRLDLTVQFIPGLRVVQYNDLCTLLHGLAFFGCHF